MNYYHLILVRAYAQQVANGELTEVQAMEWLGGIGVHAVELRASIETCQAQVVECHG